MRAFAAIFLHVSCLFSFNGKALAGPTTENAGKYPYFNPITNNHQNEWTSILSSIESRIKNLDNLYTNQLTPTLETRLEHFQNRISGMEIKLLRIEALLTTKLDRMSDNISSRHFRDDMVQTDLFRKIETAYDGITHRLAYMDRKSDNDFLKIQGKVETISKKLENMDDALTTKHDSIESELSDYVSGVEDLRSFFRNAEEKLTISLEKHSNITSEKQAEIQEFSKRLIVPELTKIISSIHENVTENLAILRRELNVHNNNTGKTMRKLSHELEVILNEYASKVSDLGEQVTKSDNKIASHLKTIEVVTNSTRIETQNGLRALMVQVGKITNKEQSRYEVVDQRVLADMGETLNANFEKIISTQNSFLESCHRVQMDESQMETQISDILNKLIDNFAKTGREQHHTLRKIDGLLAKHDAHTKREMHQINENIMSVFERDKKTAENLDVHLRKTGDNLEALFALVQNQMGHTNVKRGLHLRKHDEIEEIIKNLERLQSTQYEISNRLVDVMKNIEFMKNSNTTQNILETVTRTNKLISDNKETLGAILKSVKSPKIAPQGRSSRANSKNSTSDVDELINKIFFKTNRTDTNQVQVKISDNEPDCLDYDIDVRFKVNSTGKPSKKCIKANSTENNTDGLLFPTDEEISQKKSLEFPIDVRFGTSSNDKLENRTEHLDSTTKKSNVTLENANEEKITTEIANFSETLN